MFSDRLTKDDIKVFAAVLEKPSGGYPNASRWYETVSSHLATRFVVLCRTPFLVLLLFCMISVSQNYNRTKKIEKWSTPINSDHADEYLFT